MMSTKYPSVVSDRLIEDNLQANRLEYGDPVKWEKEFWEGRLWGDTEYLSGLVKESLLPHITPPWGSVLDIGVGYGRTVELFRKDSTRYVGIDINECCISACRQRYNGEFLLSDGVSVPLDSTQAFDLIISVQALVIMDWNIVKSYIQEIARLLKKNTGVAWIDHSGGTVQGLSPRVGARSVVLREWVDAYCTEVGLTVEKHYDRIKLPNGLYAESTSVLTRK